MQKWSQRKPPSKDFGERFNKWSWSVLCLWCFSVPAVKSASKWRLRAALICVAVCGRESRVIVQQSKVKKIKKLLWMLSCIWAWLLTRADNQIYFPESSGLHNAPHCGGPPLCLSPASRPRILPCSKANYTPQKQKSPWFKESLFFRGLTLLGREPGFLVKNSLFLWARGHRHTSVSARIHLPVTGFTHRHCN